MFLHCRFSKFVRTLFLFGVFACSFAFAGAPEAAAQRLPAGSPCPVVTRTPYRSPLETTVYLVTPECTRRPFFNPNVYFSYFESWNQVIFLESEEISAIAKDKLNFMPWGPRREFGNGSLVKVTSDPRVYLIQEGKAYPIESEEAFKALGYSFDQVEDVAVAVLSSFSKQSHSIKGIEDAPTSLVFKYPDDPAVYVLEKEGDQLVKKHVASMEELAKLGRADRIAILPVEHNYPNASGSSSGTDSSSQSQDSNSSSQASTESTSSNASTGSSSGGSGGGGGGGSSAPSDTTAPSISAFSLPSSSTSLSVSVSLAASDAVGVTGYYFSEASSTPASGAAGWISSVPSTHTFASYGLKTLYVWAKDSAGNVSSPASATTTISDIAAPTISSVASSTTLTTATITWTTDEVSTSTVSYGLTASYGSTSSSAASVTSHSMVLTGLSSGTTYHFRVGSQDAAGNVATSTDYTFTTVTPDTTAPTISSVASSTTPSTATITWTTDEASTSTVSYGLTTGYGSTSSSASSVTSHSINLTGLTSGTVYHFRVSSQDASGNVATSSDYTFTTVAVDSTAPVISSVASSTTLTTATITWTTNEASTSTVSYGLTTGYGSTSSSALSVTSHSIVLTGLTASTTYHFRVGSQDTAGNVATSTDYTFRTTIPVDSTAPVISSVASSTTLTTATITWTTDEASTSTVEYGTTTGYGTASSSALSVTSHSIVVSGLSGGTTYHFRVGSQDTAGNVATSTDYTFRTSPDVTAPTISGVATSTDGATGATLAWTTNESATTLVEYGTSTDYGSTSSTAGYSTSHSVNLTGLTPNTTYYYRLSSQDAAGNSVSSTGTFMVDEMIFTITGSSFSAIVTVTTGTSILWTYADGTTTSTATSTKSFGSSATRLARLKVTPWSGLRGINVGFDGGDGGSFADFAALAQQNVVSVTGMEHAAPYLVRWASSNNPITSLDFRNFVNVEIIECYLCQQMTSVDLRNTPSLIRADFEDNALTALDFSESPNVEDIRGAVNNYSVITWGSSGSRLWHYCTRDNPQLTTNHPSFVQFPLLNQLWIWNDNQSGELRTSSTALQSVQAYSNHYTSAYLAGQFPAGRNGEVILWNNNLTSIDISNNPGLMTLDLRNNNFDQADIDGILQVMDSFGTSNGTIYLSDNVPPSQTGQGYVTSLQSRGWTVSVDASADVYPPTISSVASSTGVLTATITWTTNEASTSTVEYGTTTGYGSTSSSADSVTSHTITLTGLATSTLYHFRVSSQDSYGNYATSSDYTFTTLTSPDLTGPVISSVASSTNGISATITWTTNEVASTRLDYGLTTGYGSTSSSSALVTSHSIALSSLTADTLYHFRIVNTDLSGNVTTSTDYTFRTPINTTYWSDDFERADGALGNGWLTFNSAAATIVSGAMRRSDTAAYRAMYNSTNVTLPADYYVTVTVPHSTLSTNWWGIAGRWNNNEGVRVIFTGPNTITAGQASTHELNNQTITVTGGIPASWSVNQNHTLTLQLSGTSATIYLDGSEYGTFTLATNNQTGTGVAIVGEGNNRDWYDISVTDFLVGEDTTAPTISSVASSTTETTATITWTTNEASTSTVSYGLTSGYGSTSSSASSVTSHSMVLTGLSSGTTYHFRVGSQDAAGNVATSTDYTFTTVVVDTTGPVISSVASSTAATTATITWTTNEASTSTVSYGLTTGYGSTSSSASLVTSHSITLTGLNASTTYHFRVSSQDASGNVSTSTDYTFKTAATSSQILIDESSVAEFSSLTSGQIEAASALTLMFRHASVGSNISSGLDALQSGNAIYNRTNFSFQARGNPGWELKLSDFETEVASQASSYGILSMKFCWIDYQASSTAYINTMNALEAAYPSKTFIWWTMPVHVSDTLADNAAFNADIRAYATANNKVLFDLASIESHQANGTPCTSGGIENMCAEWTDDGGHLDADGQQRVAQAFWVLMSTLAEGGVLSDTTAPTISSVASSTTASTATITWTTNESSTSTVSYGLTTGYGSTSSSASSVTSHSIVLTGLNASTTYHFRVGSQDAAGNVATSTDYIFTTAATSSVTTHWSDDFERADGAVGNGWVGNGSASATIVGGALRRLDGAPVTSWVGYQIYSNPTNVTLPADYFVTATIPHSTIGTNYWGIAGRWAAANGVRVMFTEGGVITAGDASGWNTNDQTITVTGGIPASWSVNQNHTLTIGFSGTTATIYLDGSEYGTFTLATNNQTGTGVAIVGEGNSRDWYDISVTDALAGEDTIAPTISSVASSTLATTATISWTTNEASTSTVEYGATNSYGSTSSSATFVTSHSVVLTGLTASTTYHFRVSSQDASGNVATSTDYLFTTSSTDTTAPTISSVASSTTASTATITWTTNESSTSTVSYGLTTGYGSTSSSASSVTSHSIVLTGLTASTTYHFRVSSQDASGNYATSSDYTFRTAATSSVITYWADDFERANGAVGNGWTQYIDGVATIVSGAMRRTDTGSYRGMYNAVTSTTLPADYFVTATIPHSTLSTSFWGIAGRWLGSNGVRVFFENPTTITAGEAVDWNYNNQTITVTGGIPASWSVNQNHTLTLGLSGTTGTIYLDGSEYGTFTLATNNQTGTGVAIVGEGNSRDWYDVTVTDSLP